ncbi:MAG: InlB B-repeat-containing protein, partial [Candidatus Bathyarchaeota archaeon]|nr:InlB B-repeat-containing protein [Candidatus Termiticorpusculum sp.]
MVTVLLDQVDGSQDDVVHIVTNSFYGVGQGFTGNGAKVFEARFHVGSSFPVLGNLFRAAIYNHSGTWGSGLPTGTPLAVSENRDATELVPDASGWVTFQFTGVNQFQTVAGQHYFIVFEYVDPDDPLYSTVHIYFTTQSSTFNGGSFVCFNSYNNINQWEVYGYGERLCFQLYGSLPFFSVMYNGNGATGGSVPVDSNTYNEGSVVTVATNSGNLVRTNYIFKGWSTSSSGTAPTYINNNNTITPATFIMSSSNIVLFAVWDLASNQTYTVIYNGNGNTGGSTPTDNNGPYQAGNTVTVLNQGSLTKSNHTFLGWSTDNTATSPLYTTSSTFTINCAMVLYAIWIPLRTVTYNGNGATSGSAPVDSNSPYIDGSSVVVMGQNTLLKTKHVFIGWSTDNTAFLAQYTPTSTFIITGGNVILYAV